MKGFELGVVCIDTYFTKNGRNGAMNFTIRQGTMSARSMAPVDM